MLKKSLKRILISSGAMRLASRVAGSGAAIIMYHSVEDDPSARNLDALGGIIHSTDVFRGQMETIARHFSPVTLDRILNFVKEGKDLPPRPVVVTFDDGYRDNYHVAKPILDQVGIPAVFYVAVASIDQGSLPWSSQLRHMFLTSKAKGWREPAGQTWPLETRERRLAAFEQASQHCARLSGSAQKAFLDQMQGDVDAVPLNGNASMMTWDEIRGLERGGHTVGSHTMTHPNMAHITPQEASVELADSKHRLEQELGKPVPHFSYPCPALQPHWSSETVELSRELGYLTGVTTLGGLVRKGDNALHLRRIRPTKTVDGLRWNLECAFAGKVV